MGSRGRPRKYPIGSTLYVGCTIDIEIANAVDAVACREGMTRADAIRYLLDKALETEDW